MFFVDEDEETGLFRGSKRMQMPVEHTPKALRAIVDMVSPPDIGRQFICCYWMWYVPFIYAGHIYAMEYYQLHGKAYGLHEDHDVRSFYSEDSRTIHVKSRK